MAQVEHIPRNFDPLPTDEEVASTRQEIRRMEEALGVLRVSIVEAQRRAEEMQANIDRKRLMIAPVRRLPQDVLSLIFVACSQERWNAPQMIGAVCRLWRSFLLSTPRAWAYLHLDGLSPLRTELWVTRSFEAGVHALSNRWISSLAGTLKIRAEVLVTLSLSCREESWPTILRSHFPRLVVLSLENTGEYGDSWRPEDKELGDILDWSNFPSLKRLHLTGLSDSGACLFVGKGSCPFEELVLVKPEGRAWVQILEHAAESLASLGLRLGSQSSRNEDDSPLLVYLPQLVHLTLIISELSFLSSPLIFPVDLTTPRLRSYHEKSMWNSGLVRSPVHQDVSSVSEAFINTYASYFDLSKFHSLEQLIVDRYLCHRWGDALRHISPQEHLNFRRICVIDEFGTASLDLFREIRESHKLSGWHWDLVIIKSFRTKYYEHEEWVQGVAKPLYLHKW